MSTVSIEIPLWFFAVLCLAACGLVTLMLDDCIAAARQWWQRHMFTGTSRE